MTLHAGSTIRGSDRFSRAHTSPQGDSWQAGHGVLGLMLVVGAVWAVGCDSSENPTDESTGGSNAAGRGGIQSNGGSATSGGTTTGGRANGGGATGGTATGGTSTGGGCTVSPVDPQATQQAKNLLCYLYSIYKRNVLSGQQETSWASDPNADVAYYNRLVAKYPAVLGGDYLYPNGTTSRAQAYWSAGGIPMLRYHMGAPPNSDTYNNSKLNFSSTQCTNVVTAGTSENTSLRSKLDYLAQELQTLQNANVPVILALYHETQANGWFWWSKCSGSQFIALYQYTYDYLVRTKGIHNLVRLMPFSGYPSSSYWPGSSVVDIGGPDEYSSPSSQPFASLYSASASIIGTSMPIPLHETGTIPQPANMFPSAAPWLLWNVWAGYYTGAHDPGSGTAVTFNTDANLQTAYASSYTITRDEVPSLR